MNRISNRALLIGNGVNLLDGNKTHSWGYVLKKLSNMGGLKPDPLMDEKPFPLLFEAIQAQVQEWDKLLTELDMKERVAEFIEELRPNPYHQKLVNLPVSQILTTNYDYCLERSFGRESLWDRKRRTKETKFSIFRYYPVSDCKVWHIHGEKKYPRTIMLGHGHYSAYLDKVRSLFVKTGEDEEDVPTEETENTAGFLMWDHWMNIFLTHHVDIIGFGFDFTETILWWLLHFKNKRQHRLGIEGPEICFHAFNDTGGIYAKAEKAKHELLKNFGVKVITYKEDSYEASYDRFIDFYPEFKPAKN